MQGEQQHQIKQQQKQQHNHQQKQQQKQSQQQSQKQQLQQLSQQQHQPIQIYKEKLLLTITPSETQPKMHQYLKIIADVLAVDKELNIDQLKKTITYDEKTSQITIEFGCVELKLLRSCITGFLRHMHLVAKTIQLFKAQA